MDIFHVEGSLLSLFFFVILSFSVSGIIFALTVKPRTESQVEKIPDDKIKEFFTKNNIN
ncbi:putative phage membrane protein [Escherichia coli 3-020-07_S1_C3]|nr:putative phage membrane protein [Escherichia coli 3-020-07_S1_C1]KDZ26765.1 putative phage membrane protein [Escherichia coli 3-020-07_S1_C2]KDZ31969.1 putative phage membrane protein [Escherichia coli 3-020-07_S1_C3]